MNNVTRLKSTTDIWFGSFLRMKGFNVKNYEVISKGRGKYFFDVEMELWKQLKLEFDSSEISKLKLHQIALKDLLH